MPQPRFEILTAQADCPRLFRDWQLVEYKEELGSMHARDEAGNPIQFKFVTMLAKKPE